MAINKLPPQAYTKDDINKAYLWVQSQPDYVKNMATSKETLVALYLQARRGGNASIENLAPVSSKDFTSQLQTLATELEQFEGAQTIPNKPVQKAMEEKIVTKETRTVDHQQPKPTAELDPKSEQIIQSVKAHLNLESDTEVIRMLLVLGYERVKEIFPTR